LGKKPVLHIAARDWPRRAGSRPDDAIMPVRVYSNESPVELFVNGTYIGSTTVNSATAVWNVGSLTVATGSAGHYGRSLPASV